MNKLEYLWSFVIRLYSIQQIILSHSHLLDHNIISFTNPLLPIGDVFHPHAEFYSNTSYKIGNMV